MFTVNFTNNTNSHGSFCLFQQKHNCTVEGVFPLAWLVRYARANSTTSVSWNTDFHLFHSLTGWLGPTVAVGADEKLGASLTNNNAVKLNGEGRFYRFTSQYNDRQGVLSIETGHNIRSREVSVGIGMSGSGTYAIQALSTCKYVFAPDPDYWVCFGHLQQGSVLEPSSIKKAIQVSFPEGIFSVNVTLNADYTWTITQGKS